MTSQQVVVKTFFALLRHLPTLITEFPEALREEIHQSLPLANIYFLDQQITVRDNANNPIMQRPFSG
jgi:hypothetical protein